MKRIACIIAAVIAFAAPAMLHAQSAAPTQSSYASGPWQQDAVVGIQHKSVAVNASSAALASTKSQGEPIALMVVGGAAIVLGALMDNGAGPFLMVGGTVVGLYGLYLYLR